MLKSDYIKKHKNELLIAVGLLCALILLLSSGCQNEEGADEISISTEEYESGLEARLETLISQIDGIGSVEVMVSMECGLEYVYAKDSEISDSTEKEEYFTDGDKNALILKEITPRVRGVAVVCSTGDSVKTQKKIISLVSSLLNISSTQIFVGA